MWRLLSVAFALGLFAAPAAAVQPDEILADPALERRARDISSGLRCLVCQNQSIDDSDAPLAKDLRVLVRERLKAGETDTAVRDYIVQRYGEFVLLRPLLGRHTLILWLTPVLVLALGGVGLFMALRRGRREPGPLAAEERARLESLLKPDGEASR